MLKFHENTGTKILLSNQNRSAERTNAKTDFNNGIVFSENPLETNVIFQVRIEKKVGLWTGGIEIGVTKINPNLLTKKTIPQSATELRNGTWLMSSKTILHDGETLIENYGSDLEKLNEGDTVGLERTTKGELVIFINGTSQGIVSVVPDEVWCIVNLYGKCTSVSLVDVDFLEQSSNTIEHPISASINSSTTSPSIVYVYSSPENNSENDKLRFHSNCGPLVKLSRDNRTAERRRPMEEFNNAVVLTHRPLRDDELFQIRIDMLVQKWSGSLEFGLTSHFPSNFEFPATMTIMRNGTIIMSGNGILHDGKATNSPYTNFNLDQLQEGDRIGIMKKSNGQVHYYVNGTDNGVAISNITGVWHGCINLYGMASKVTIVDRNEREEHNLRLNVRNPDYIAPSSNVSETDGSLLFHRNCGFHASVINNGRSAHRPNAKDDFNHGVVLTNRTLKSNELFEVILDKMVTKWAGSIEIGVSTHEPTRLDYPCTMTNLGQEDNKDLGHQTWMMTGNGIMKNGLSIVDDYGQSLDRLKVGDRVGVLRKENGDLHFFVNSEDQGCAATNVPENVYGVIDLYGQASMATIVHHTNENIPTDDRLDRSSNNLSSRMGKLNISNSLFASNSELILPGDLRFHQLHGRNAKITNSGLTAIRTNSLGEFNAAIVMTNRPLRDNEVFEVVIERMVDRWSGGLELGITNITPEQLQFPNTATDIDHDTWMLSGSSIMSCGTTITNRYNCNLDTLAVGSRVGVMRKSDSTLHYFVNGEDCGIAAFEIPENVYGVIDLYGQCASVSITKIGSNISSQLIESLSLPLPNDQSHRFSVCCGKNIMLKNGNLTATRVRHYSHGLLFSSTALDYDETFEIRLGELKTKWGGTLNFGVTSLSICDEYQVSNIPNRIGGICANTWYICGSQVKKNNSVIKDNYCMNLNRLSEGDRLGIRISGSDKTMRLLINGEEVGIAAYNIPKKVHAIVDLFGAAESCTITSMLKSVISPGEPQQLAPQIITDSNMEVSSHSILQSAEDHSGSSFIFDTNTGKNIELFNEGKSAKRTSSYNQGIVLSSNILRRDALFQIKIDKINLKWKSSLMIGILENNSERISFPTSAFSLKQNCVVICEDSVYQNGFKIKEKIGHNLDNLEEGSTVGIMIDSESNLNLFINQENVGIFANNIGSKSKAFVDLYGQCEEISIYDGGEEKPDLSSSKEKESLIKSEKIEKSEEKTSPNLIESTNFVKDCEYLNLCIRFKSTLCIPENFFVLGESVLCYCTNCHRNRGDQIIYKQGDPEADFAIPIAWVRFPINITFDGTSNNLSTSTISNSNNNPLMTSSTSLNNVLTTWHIAYYGLKIPHVRRIMDFGQLYPDVGNGFIENFPVIKTKGKKDEKTDGVPLYFSPACDYATISEFSPKCNFKDYKTGKSYKVSVCFQILIQPGSYKRGPPTYPSQYSRFCTPILDYDTIEWSTKEQGSTHVSGFLIRLEESDTKA